MNSQAVKSQKVESSLEDSRPTSPSGPLQVQSGELNTEPFPSFEYLFLFIQAGLKGNRSILRVWRWHKCTITPLVLSVWLSKSPVVVVSTTLTKKTPTSSCHHIYLRFDVCSFRNITWTQEEPRIGRPHLWLTLFWFSVFQGPVIYAQLDHSGSKSSFHKNEPVVYADIRKNWQDNTWTKIEHTSSPYQLVFLGILEKWCSFLFFFSPPFSYFVLWKHA